MSGSVLEDWGELKEEIKSFIQNETPLCEEKESLPIADALAIYLTIKILLKDWEDEWCAPPQSIVPFWTQFVLYTAAYRKFGDKFCSGHTVHFQHWSDINYNYDKYKAQYLLAYSLVRRCSEDYMEDRDIWPIPTLLDAPCKARPAPTVSIRVGEASYCFTAHPNSRVRDLKKRIAKVSGTAVRELVLDGCKLNDRKRLHAYPGIFHGSVIEVKWKE